MTPTPLSEQYYLFTMPDDMCPVWAEMHLPDGTHLVAPMPYEDLKTSAAALRSMHADATIDVLGEAADIEQCRGWARTMPLEQVPA
jgi:hypothetical protein